MTLKHRLRASCAVVASAALLHGSLAAAAEPVVLGVPSRTADINAFVRPIDAPTMSHAQKIALLKQKVKYVFVLFQENRSFDQHFGTFPGAVGLFSQPAAQTPGFVQPIVRPDGSVGSVSPFLITQTVKDVNGATVPLYPADTDSVDHSHTGIVNSMDFDPSLVARSDRYALDQEGYTTNAAGAVVSIATGQPPVAVTPTPASIASAQKAELSVSHLDCDTLPFLWQYADRFTLFDNFHMTITGPSTPNALAMIAGQSGETQWVLHPGESSANTGSPVVQQSGGVPVVGDPGPFPGSNLDTSATRPPYGFDENPARPTLNQTYASLPLSFMGPQAPTLTAADQNPALDLADVQHDIAKIASSNKLTVPWGWYQEGYDAEPTDNGGAASHATYIVHHNGPQYFGYVGDNPTQLAHLHGLADFFTDIGQQALPAQGGVFYVRGGFGNNDGLKPVDPNAAVQKNFTGGDDHPAYSDAQISEAMVADEVNAIAASPYWKDSAIVITYDETDGLYDHVPSHVRELDPQGHPLTAGPRIPAIVISPYGRVHAISHQYSEHSSVIKFIDELFDMTPLADLPDESRARELGETQFGQANLGPADAKVPGMGDLTGAFDDLRLRGKAPVLPASYATIAPAAVHALPQYRRPGLLHAQHRADRLPGRHADRPAAGRLQPAPVHHPGRADLGHLDALSGSRRAAIRGPGCKLRPLRLPATLDPSPMSLPARLAALALLVAVVAAPAPAPGRAGAVLDRVRAAGTLACGVLTEPADYTHDDSHGPLPAFGVDLCRAVAAAVLGRADAVRVLGLPDEADGFAALAAGRVDVLMGAAPSLLAEQARGVAFARPVFLDGEAVMVPTGGGVAGLDDLAGRSLCFIASQPGHEALDAALARRQVKAVPFPFEELGEMEAAFVGGRCDAMAGPASQLAESRSAFGPVRGRYAILPERLSLDPVAPAVAAGDPAWRDVVDYAAAALIEAEALGVTQANVAAMRTAADPALRQLLGTDPAIGRALGLVDDWAARVIAAVGNYGEVFDRDLGAGSPLRLPRGANAPWNLGGALVPPPFR